MSGKTYLVNKATNKKYRLDGIKRATQQPEKPNLTQAFRSHVLYAPAQLPPKVDLRQQMTTIEDQSQLASCVANTLAGAYEYLTKKANGRDTDVSRLFIYYNARAKADDAAPITDSGCTMTDAIEALEQFGTCLESLWPYELANVNTRPSDEAFEQAKDHRINQALRVDINLNEMKSCLAQGFPIAFGLQLFGSFDNASKTGVVPMPNPNDGTRESHGNHAMLAVGYSDQSRAFIVRNSWGEDWGDKGYCYIPYDYLTNIDHCFDTWTVRKLMNDDFGQANWSYDDGYNYLDDKGETYYPDDNVIETFDETGQEIWTNDENNPVDDSTINPNDENTTTVEYVDETYPSTTDSVTTDSTNFDTEYSSTETN